MSLLDDAELISGGNPDILSRIYVIKAEPMIKSKDYQGATEWIQKSLEISKEKNGDAWELKGDIAMATQDTKNAIIFSSGDSSEFAPIKPAFCRS